MGARNAASDKRSVAKSRKGRNAPTHEEKLRFVTKFKQVDPTSKSAVSRAYNTLRKISYLHREATAKQRQELEKRGFTTTDKGVFIDSPRNADRKQIPGAKLEIQKSGTIKWTVKRRRDLIVGLSPHEKQKFALAPTPYIDDLVKRLRKTNPSFKNIGDNFQVRLQWGSFQATKDFSPTQFTKVYPFMAERKRTKAKAAVMDRLTGIHIVYHVKGKK